MATKTTPERIQVRAQAKWVRMSARKARLVLDHLRGRTVPEARTIVQRGLLWAARVPGVGDDPVPTNPYK